METISFKKIYDAIKIELQKKSIDAVYNNTHEYFENCDFLMNKMVKSIHTEFNLGFHSEIIEYNYYFEKLFHISSYRYQEAKKRIKYSSKETDSVKVVEDYEKFKTEIQKLSNNSYDTFENLAIDLERIKGVDKDSIPEYHDQFLIESFKIWTDKNLKRIQTFQNDKKDEISNCVKELEKTENVKKQTTKSIEKETIKKKSLQLKIDSLQNEISQSSKRKESYENQIKRNIEEIHKIKSTPEFIGKKPYDDRIKDLEKENIKLPKDFEKHNEALLKEIEKNRISLQKIETRISKLELQVKNIEKTKNQVLSRKEILENDNTSFSIDEESNFYNELHKILFNSKGYLFNESILFNESFTIHQNLDYNRIKETLLTRVSASIPSKTYNNYVEVLRKLNDDKFLTLNPYQNTDDVAAIFLAISSSFIDKNAIRTETGVIYINFGNGIIAKLIVRENIDNINEDIVLIGEKRKGNNNNTRDKWYCSTYKDEYIFSGYTDSGFILNVGIYIITKELVFEIFFKASSLLIDNKYIPLFQEISDGKKKADVDYEEELYND
jgi:predicted  nucleic acid-binding Zn-ribbon protein